MYPSAPRRSCARLPERAGGGEAMALVVDTGALYALYDRRDKHHRGVRDAVSSEHGPLLIPVAILAEITYLLEDRLGPDAELRFLEGIIRGSFTLCPFTVEDAAFCADLLAKYSDLNLGFADASVIAAAERLGVNRILTLDRRDFGPVRNRKGDPYELLPAGA
jgi:hypothetical protein